MNEVKIWHPVIGLVKRPKQVVDRIMNIPEDRRGGWLLYDPEDPIMNPGIKEKADASTKRRVKKKS
jgi:hypothetical protein